MPASGSLKADFLRGTAQALPSLFLSLSPFLSPSLSLSLFFSPMLPVTGLGPAPSAEPGSRHGDGVQLESPLGRLLRRMTLFVSRLQFVFGVQYELISSWLPASVVAATTPLPLRLIDYPGKGPGVRLPCNCGSAHSQELRCLIQLSRWCFSLSFGPRRMPAEPRSRELETVPIKANERQPRAARRKHGGACLPAVWDR